MPYPYISQVTGANLRDQDWVRKTFMMSAGNLNSSLQQWRTYTTASQKFTDTRLGGNFAINNPPQFTRFADIKNSGIAAINNGSKYDNEHMGMGRYYSEAIDDNAQRINMTFGTPQYNGMLTFFTGFYDQDASLLARTGRADGIIYSLAKIAGTVITLPFAVFIALGDAASFFFGRNTSKYYYFQPSMGPYWNRVNLIANMFAVNMGLHPRLGQKNQSADVNKMDDVATPASSDYTAFASTVAPDIFRPQGGVDVYAVANKATRMADQYYTAMKQLGEGATDRADLTAKISAFLSTVKIKDPGSEGIDGYLIRYHTYAQGSKTFAFDDASTTAAPTADASSGGPTVTAQDANAATVADGTAGNAPGTPPPSTQPSYRTKWQSAKGAVADALENVPGFGLGANMLGAMVNNAPYLTADLREGSAYVTWRVENLGMVSESFSNATGDSEIAGTINGMSSSARNKRFDLSGGNTGIGIIDGIKNAVGDVAAGLLDGVQASGLLALAGSAFVDIPQIWTGSTAQFPTFNYTMELRSFYGNKLSRFTNMYVPLAMLLAAALPQSTGRQSYTGPMLCQLYHQGRGTVKLGLIDSLTVERGVGNMGFNNKHEVLGIDVHFSVKDLSSIMHAPIDCLFDPLKPWKGIFDDDNPFNDYMAVLGNLSMADQVYPLRKLAINLANKEMAVDSYFSWSHASNALGNGWLGRTLGAVLRANERII